MLARIVLLSAFCLSCLGVAALQANTDKPSTATEPPAVSQQTPIAIGPGISPPKPIFAPDPEYPTSNRRGKHTVQGTCVLGLTVDEHGSVRDIHIIRSLDMRLDQNAIDAVKQWKFNPALKDGKPVAVFTWVEVGFLL